MGHSTRLWRRVIDRELQPYGLTQATWLPLLHISRSTTPMNQKELAEAIGFEASAVVRLLDNLQKQGLIERREGADRRIKEIHLTPQGVEQVKNVEDIARQVRIKALNGLSEENIAQVNQAVEHVIANLSAIERSDI
ncbi:MULTISPECIES: MarR family transcriptional regulator [unclassified Brenneria]|uniref:MarR family winged helix-turn-helix transcriptional regulator n=1 Tax=unclassified Brenneria TaxID=2634434 RepID=UPI0029C56CF1|nr:MULTISPECIES: MarR family transcriptional regulator [unclassified Brenneria]MDX5628227.1 MarR family transcriptional regulator [Brenneria sp. L3-3Z]MDX5695590.1 MarR family transcriptional regulator [Brenneria sp. L4-2C]MEE3662439.1 MarR family transcriptional regulator [Brenneria sp. g21c3]